MICRECQMAGDLNKEGLAGTAEVHHSRCSDPSCSCEHATGTGHYS